MAPIRFQSMSHGKHGVLKDCMCTMGGGVQQQCVGVSTKLNFVPYILHQGKLWHVMVAIHLFKSNIEPAS